MILLNDRWPNLGHYSSEVSRQADPTMNIPSSYFWQSPVYWKLTQVTRDIETTISRTTRDEGYEIWDDYSNQ
jgi:hypothetical protein